MTSRFGVTPLFLALWLPCAAQASEDEQVTGDPPAVIEADVEWESGAPSGSEALPPPPATEVPPPPQAGPQPAPPAGQWVDTQQYGRIWMPYSDLYAYAPPSGAGEPYQYVYYPLVGWTWVVAPWIWGWGPWPVFGLYGPARYGWYAHGWWRTPYRWHYAPGYRSGGYRGGVPGPYHGGHGGRVAAPPGYRSAGTAPRAVAPRGVPSGRGSGGGGWGHPGGGRASGGHASGGRGR